MRGLHFMACHQVVLTYEKVFKIQFPRTTYPARLAPFVAVACP